MKSIIYLACPYTHPDRAIRLERFQAASRAAASLMAQGKHVFSPISHTHPIAEVGELPLGWDFWEGYDKAFLSIASEMIVLKVPGWESSKGVQAEIRIAQEMGLPVSYLEVIG